MIFAEAYPLLRELHSLTEAAVRPGADVAGLAERLEPIARRVAQDSASADCALLWWPSSYADYFTDGLESTGTLGTLLAAGRGPVVWVQEPHKLAAISQQARAFVNDAVQALSTAGRVITVDMAEAGLAGGLCAGVVTANAPLAEAFRTWGRPALTSADDVQAFVASLAAPDLAGEVATALTTTAQTLEAAFQREVLGVS